MQTDRFDRMCLYWHSIYSRRRERGIKLRDGLIGVYIHRFTLQIALPTSSIQKHRLYGQDTEKISLAERYGTREVGCGTTTAVKARITAFPLTQVKDAEDESQTPNEANFLSL